MPQFQPENEKESLPKSIISTGDTLIEKNVHGVVQNLAIFYFWWNLFFQVYFVTRRNINIIGGLAQLVKRRYSDRRVVGAPGSIPYVTK